MKKKNYQSLIAGIVFVSAIIAVILYATFNREISYQIFLTFAVTIVILGSAVSIYWYAYKVNSFEQKREQMEEFIENLEAIAVVWEENFDYVYPNRIMRERLEYTHEEISDAMVLRKVFPRDVLTPEGIGRVLENRSEEFCAQSKSGSYHYLVWNTTVVAKEKEKKGAKRLLVSIGFNVTELKFVQQQLLEAKDRYALSMELSEIGILLSEEGNSSFYISEQLQQMLGFDSSHIAFQEFRKRVHPKDYLLYDAYIQFVFSRSIAKHSGIHSLEMRLLSADNEYRWYMHRYKIIPKGTYSMVGGAFIDITKDKEKDSLIERMAYIDETTEIYNRNKLMHMGQELYNCCGDLNLSYWVIVIDIDKFHIINDACGYVVGNNILKHLAKIINKHLTDGGIVARIGGDNFAMIVKDNGNADLPRETIRKIQHDFAELSSGELSSQTFSCSAGFSKMPADGKSFAEVLDRAEFALSSVEKMRGMIVSYDETTHEMIIIGSKLEKALADAIKNDELEMFYQPKVNLTNGEIIGVEALIRWRRQDGSIVSPDSFVPVAEGSKLISKISEYALYESCRQNMEWINQGLPPIIVSINMTAADFYQSGIADYVSKVLKATGMPAELLEVELTETIALKDIDQAIRYMKKLRSMGVKIAMDDFGTGYSSLSYIQVLPITMLKLDRCFAANLETDEVARKIVQAVITIAKAKKIETIAEGIETIGQVKILRSCGCDHAQGYYFAKPMPARLIAEYLKSCMKYARNINKH